MSDLIERLRDGPGDWQQEAADEIERLCSELDACGDCVRRADAEIERLRDERRALLDVRTKEGLLASEWLLRTATAEAEIERLREEVEERNAKINRLTEELRTWKETKFEVATAVLRKHDDALDSQIRISDAANAEIERLREENEHLFDRIAGLEAAMDARTPELCEKDAEIERLREEKVALISAKTVTINPPPMPESEVIDYLRQTIDRQNQDIARLRDEGQKDYDGMREFQRKFIDASHEIERLRSLVYEAIDCLEHVGCIKRIREALGE